MSNVVDLQKKKDFSKEINEELKGVDFGSGIPQAILKAAQAITLIPEHHDEMLTIRRAMVFTPSMVGVIVRDGLDFVSDLISVRVVKAQEHHIKFLIELQGQNQPSPIITISVESIARMVKGVPVNTQVRLLEHVEPSDADIFDDAPGTIRDTLHRVINRINSSIMARRGIFNEVGVLGDNMIGFALSNEAVPSRYQVNVAVVTAADSQKPYDATDIVLKTF